MTTDQNRAPTQQARECFHANCGVKDCTVKSNHGHKANVVHRGADTSVSYTIRYLPCEGKCRSARFARSSSQESAMTAEQNGSTTEANR